MRARRACIAAALVQAGAAEDPWAADALGLVAGVPVVDWRAPHRFAAVRAHEDVAVWFRVRGAGLRKVLLQVDGRRGAVVCESTPCDGRATLQVVGGGWHAAAVLLGEQHEGGYTNMTAAAAPFFVADPPVEVPPPPGSSPSHAPTAGGPSSARSRTTGPRNCRTCWRASRPRSTTECILIWRSASTARRRRQV